MLNTDKSQAAFREATRVIAGGVNSPVRSFAAVGGNPPLIASGKGAYVTDIDGNTYVDYVGSYGAAILGHAHSDVVAYMYEVAQEGLSFGAPTEGETKLAQIISTALPAVPMLRFVSSGTEACMSVLRLARAYTARNKIIKFSGCYHGHADFFLVKAGSGAATQGIATSPGVPSVAVQDTIVAPFNDLPAVEEIFSRQEIAAVIVEPLVGNCGFIRPQAGFLAALRDLCTAHGSLLIFDEVMTGFRVGWGGMQTATGVTPDLTTLGKVIGGGLPLAAFGGRTDIMQLLAPTGAVYQAGTMAGNPVAVACGIKTLQILASGNIYKTLASHMWSLVSGLMMLAKEYRVPLTADGEGGMFGLFLASEAIASYEQAMQIDTAFFRRFFHLLLERGIYLAPSPFEAGFISSCHTEREITLTLEKCEEAFRILGSG